MTVSRLCGDHTIAYHGRRRVLMVAGLLSGIGLVCTAFAPPTQLGWCVACAGLLAAGAGLGPVVPIAFSTAGAMDGVPPSVGIASMALCVPKYSLRSPAAAR